MSINLYTPFWKEVLKYLVGFLMGCFLCFWVRGCSGNEKSSTTVKVIVPEVKGNFESKKPTHVQIITKSVHDTVVMYKKGQNMYMKNPIDQKLVDENEKLKTDFAKETDSLKKVIDYNKAIQLNKFSTNFEDENLILNFEGIVQGEVKEITPSYTIKEKKVEVHVKQKQTVLRVLAGGGFGLNKELNQAAYQLDLNFQNRKGNIISAEFLRVGDQSFGMVGFKKSIINIKR
jgi:hypothetical protein